MSDGAGPAAERSGSGFSRHLSLMASNVFGRRGNREGGPDTANGHSQSIPKMKKRTVPTMDTAFVHRRESGGGVPNMKGHTTKIASLESQGLLESTDHSCAMMHESSSPPNFYAATYGHPTVINMDRGGFGHFRGGTNYACVFDGVTSGGKINAYAAQAFAEHTVKWLREHGHKFKHGTGVNDLLAKEMFTSAVAPTNNPGKTKDRAFDAEGGSATGIFITFQDTKNRDYIVANGASIGDAAAILVSADGTGARFLSCLSPRRQQSARDTGGQLTMCMGVHGAIWPFSSPVLNSDTIILCTDGLVDNIHLPELGTIIPYVINCRVFNEVPADDCPCITGEHARIPHMEDLVAFTKQPFDSIAVNVTATPQSIVQRLTNYVKWVTRHSWQTEQRFYGEAIQKQALLKEQASVKANVGLAEARKADMLSKLNFQIVTLENSSRESLRDRKKFSVGKTDDAIIIAVKPRHTLTVTPEIS